MPDLTQRPHKFVEVALGDMVVCERAQRVLKPSRVEQLLAALDLDAFGEPILSFRDGRYYIVDGQHRTRALAAFLGKDWQAATVRCKVFTGLTERDEAKLFRQVNTVLTTSAYDKFKVGVTAGFEEETKIQRIVEALGLHVCKRRGEPGSVSAVGALRAAYRLSPKSLVFSLKLATEAYGDAGLEGPIIEGFAQLHNRYDKALDDEATIDALANGRGGVKGIMNAATKRRLTTGNTFSVCIAAEAVDIINRHRKGKKLPSWWAAAAAAA